MNILNIEVRPNIPEDGKLEVSAWDELSEYNAVFRIHSDINGVIHPDSPDSMYYLDPFILTSHSLKSILTYDETNVSELQMTKAGSVIVHELTHYYQKGEFEYLHGEKYIKHNGTNDKEYICQLSELDAHAVMAYFFLKTINPTRLREIMTNTNIQTIKEKLIDEYRMSNSQTRLFD
ncbi:hypothetical protein [Chryseobacterium turcicum]|uniref:Uncharacterized protein n=1 Tax=Chryseobacterium turcicum TaxID=2898076 RepID=A0A9Q3V5W8_9FLAO|nr:hypothetical protein [Chryseobacterium turcicum]MCD1117920.1 hypothetical protein [Chryseobacterium turcicum]